jgi:hypothetical protein
MYLYEAMAPEEDLSDPSDLEPFDPATGRFQSASSFDIPSFGSYSGLEYVDRPNPQLATTTIPRNATDIVRRPTGLNEARQDGDESDWDPKPILKEVYPLFPLTTLRTIARKGSYPTHLATILQAIGARLRPESWPDLAHSYFIQAEPQPSLKNLDIGTVDAFCLRSLYLLIDGNFNEAQESFASAVEVLSSLVR